MDTNRRKELVQCLDKLSGICIVAIAVVGIFLTVFIVLAPKVWY
jgi:hypothetical protein